MIEYSIIQGDRQTGKTYVLMTEIHDQIVAGRHHEVLVVFPALNWVHWWTREWESRFPWLSVPDYITINNTIKVRGKRLSKIYVEDVDQIPDGIYNERFNDILPALCSPFNDDEVVFTSRLIEMNQRSHNAETSKREALDKAAARVREVRRQREFNDDVMVGTMLNYIERNSK